MNSNKAICLLKISAFFEKKSGRLSSVVPKTLAFSGHFLANFQPILDCFLPNSELKYENSENIKADCVNAIVFNLHHIKCRANFFWDTQYISVHIRFDLERYLLKSQITNQEKNYYHRCSYKKIKRSNESEMAI